MCHLESSTVRYTAEYRKYVLYLDYMRQLGCFYYKLEENTCNASCKNTQRYVQ